MGLWNNPPYYLTAWSSYPAGSYKTVTVSAGSSGNSNCQVVYAWKRTK